MLEISMPARNANPSAPGPIEVPKTGLTVVIIISHHHHQSVRTHGSARRLLSIHQRHERRSGEYGRQIIPLAVQINPTSGQLPCLLPSIAAVPPMRPPRRRTPAYLPEKTRPCEGLHFLLPRGIQPRLQLMTPFALLP